jgi:hypothetical protein
MPMTQTSKSVNFEFIDKKLGFLLYKCKTCGVEKPHTKEYFYLYNSSKVKNSFIRLHCKVCDKAKANYTRNIRQTIARVDKYEKRLIATIQLSVAIETNNLKKYSKKLTGNQKKQLHKYLKNQHIEALQENKKFDKSAKKEKNRINRNLRRREYEKQRRLNGYRKLLTPEQKEKKRLQNKKWREENPEHAKFLAKEWNRKNPGAASRAVMRQRAKKRSNGYEKYNEKDVIEMYGIVCYLCNKEIDITLSRKVGSERWRESLQIDHVIPVSKGGPDFLSNVRPTHALCNNLKNDKII